MRSVRDFIKDGLMLTVTALILRTAGVYFSARLSIMAGEAVMGLYTQIMSVYAFAVTAASAGINLASTRIISECYGSRSYEKLDSALRSCIKYCFKAGLIVAALMFFSAPFTGNILLRDARTVPSLRALAFALPFISVSNAFHGYFSGIRRIPPSAATSLFEQFIRIFATILALTFCKTADVQTLCLVLVICNASSEALSCFILSAFYMHYRKKFPCGNHDISKIKKRFLGITIPIAVSALIRSALTTSEHILIPIGLRAYGLDSEKALAEYGIVSGMVLPILLYPMALLTSFASITIAELSARVSAGDSKSSIRVTVEKGLTFAVIYGIGAAAVIGCFSDSLALAVYRNREAGEFLRILAPLIFFMYLDHISDGMLKGLDKQNYVMKVNIIDAALSVVFAAVLIPKFGIYGFVASLYVCEFFNCLCSFGRLFVLVRPRLSILLTFFIPIASALIAVHLSCYISNLRVYSTVSLIMLAMGVYIILLKITGALRIFEKKPVITAERSPSV